MTPATRRAPAATKTATAITLPGYAAYPGGGTQTGHAGHAGQDAERR